MRSTMLNKEERLNDGHLVMADLKTFGGNYVGVVIGYEPPPEGMSWSGDKGNYLMLDLTGRTSLYPAEYIHAIMKFGKKE